jgi:hypothetical protein
MLLADRQEFVDDRWAVPTPDLPAPVVELDVPRSSQDRQVAVVQFHAQLFDGRAPPATGQASRDLAEFDRLLSVSDQQSEEVSTDGMGQGVHGLVDLVHASGDRPTR